MPLTSINISNVRNIDEAIFDCHPTLNIIVGRNGSGKTSLLEGIYMLGRGRSFRTSFKKTIIQKNRQNIFVVGKTNHKHPQTIAIQLSEKGLIAKAKGEQLTKSSQLALILPLLMISPDADKLIEGGPKQRRRFIDWGLFHVEHSYLSLWKRYNRALIQRNTVLKRGAKAEIKSWDEQLIEYGMALTAHRRQYCQDLEKLFLSYLPHLTDNLNLGLHYRPGWLNEESLREALFNSFQGDSKVGFTQKGPHRADLCILLDGKIAVNFLSGGQQKLVACALILAQAKLLNQRLNDRGILLVDDLPAELDPIHRESFLTLLNKIGSQLFVTTTEASLLPLDSFPSYTMFHVEHGKLSVIKKT